MREKQNKVKEILRKVARKNNLTEEDVEKVEESMWSFIKHQIQTSDIENEDTSNVYLRFLGTIFVAPNRIKRIKENIKKQKK